MSSKVRFPSHDDPRSSMPLNIWSRADEEIARLMSHFAHTPFSLYGVRYGSVEAFYTWLLCDDVKRPKVAPMWGARSKHACPKCPPDAFDFHGRTVIRSSPEHYDLILCANRAKLIAHPGIARAFVATLPRPIVHDLPDKDDAHHVFCDIMRTIRREFAASYGVAGSTP